MHDQVWFLNVLTWFCLIFLSPSWILWWCCPRTEWHHRVAWFPPRLSQLRQLYMADNNRGEEPNPANLRHAGAGGRLRYCISLRWTAISWQLKNEVWNDSLINSLFFFLLHCCSLSLAFLFSNLSVSLSVSVAYSLLQALTLWSTSSEHKVDIWTAAYFFEYLFLLNWKWHSQRTVSVSFNLSRFPVILNKLFNKGQTFLWMVLSVLLWQK